MQPYVVKQGDYLAKIAYRFGFDAATVWMQDENSDLRALRCNPNILNPCDILYIPEPADPEAVTLEVGQTNTFTSDPPTAQVVVQFKGTEADPSMYASQPFEIAELPDLTGLTTDPNGVAKIDVPVTLSSITLTFTNTGASQSILIADMDPINTLAGIFKRLQHLGFISQNSTADPSDLDVLRSALRMLKASVASATDSAPSGGSASDDSPSSDDGPPSSDGDPPSSDSDPPSSDDGPPSSDDGADSSADSTSDDDSGLSDDGVLDDDTTKLLLEQHGS